MGVAAAVGLTWSLFRSAEYEALRSPFFEVVLEIEDKPTFREN